MPSWFLLTKAESHHLNPPEEPGEGWLPLGHIPEPRNRWEWLIVDLWHGWAMHYPLLKVLGWSAWHWMHPEARVI